LEASACILALDLGTSAFKAAAVTPVGLVGEPVSIPYELDYAEGRVTCPAERYFDTAMAALRQAIVTARAAGLRIEAIGLSSQAQTYVELDRTGRTIADFVVWTDDRAAAEAARASQVLPDAAAHCGFRRFTGQQFLPKVMHLLAEREIDREGAAARGASAIDDAIRSKPSGKFLLLNEYLAHCLTCVAFGDETNQGMSGFFDITRRAWSPKALALSGITADQLATVAPAAMLAEPLTEEIRRALDLDAIPVYQCGNDQTCAAAGVDLDEPGDVLCNFGTAMVVYSRKQDLPATIFDSQIAGIDPLTSRYFLLGLEGECGNVIEWLADRVYPGQGIEPMLRAAVDALSIRFLASPPKDLFTLSNWKETFDRHTSLLGPEQTAQMILAMYRGRFLQLLEEIRGPVAQPGKLIASGGLSRSQAWLDFLEQETSVAFVRAPSEHPGLLGIARIIARNQIVSQ